MRFKASYQVRPGRARKNRCHAKRKAAANMRRAERAIAQSLADDVDKGFVPWLREQLALEQRPYLENVYNSEAPKKTLIRGRCPEKSTMLIIKD